MNRSFYEFYSEESPEASGDEMEGGNMGHRPGVKGGYFPVAPVDAGGDIRAEMVSVLLDMGVRMDKHHHEVAPAQHELGITFSTMTDIADKVAASMSSIMWRHLMAKRLPLCPSL